jgi:hypothetical protein
MKRILASTLLALPLAVTFLPTQVKAASLVLPTPVTTQSPMQSSYEIARYVREWIPGHWTYHYGRRHWIHGRWASVWRRGWG